MRGMPMVPLFLWLGVLPVAAQNDSPGIVRYDCEKPVCNVRCAGKNTNLALKYKTLTVFRMKDHPERLWITVDDDQYPIADDATCKFEGKPIYEFGPATPAPLGLRR